MGKIVLILIRYQVSNVWTYQRSRVLPEEQSAEVAFKIHDGYNIRVCLQVSLLSLSFFSWLHHSLTMPCGDDDDHDEEDPITAISLLPALSMMISLYR